eukprot:Nitzschia sp. Nitz4//scaffold73_size107353//77999//79155//NITZ4_004328-RA/size107353-processed-gene-0.196-mRNA-1//-1//CDS//3329557500//8061//frame0
MDPRLRAFMRNMHLSTRNILQHQGEMVVRKAREGMEAILLVRPSSPGVTSFLSNLCLSNNGRGLSLESLYALSLLGSSCGFYLLLYFITFGYTLGVGLPVTLALASVPSQISLPPQTWLHSTLTIAWSLRLFTFLLWREIGNGSAFHRKVVHIQSKFKVSRTSRFLCWTVYSFFYAAMASMNWSRLCSKHKRWGILGYLGLGLQMVGLGLETVADYQKSVFKRLHRHAWCNVGVWHWSTHPHYLGEGLFWGGTYLAHGFESVTGSLLATIGLGFILAVLKGSTRSLAIKQLERYGDQAEFFDFQRQHSIWGPKRLWMRKGNKKRPLTDDATRLGKTTTLNGNSKLSNKATAS